MEEYVESVSAEERMDIGFCLFNFQDEMVQKAMNKCFEGVTAEKVHGRGFCYLYGDVECTLVHDLVKLALRDSGMDGTDDEVRAQIVERTKKISQQMPSQVVAPVDLTCKMCVKKQFLNSRDILRDVSIEYLTTDIGGEIYVDVGGKETDIKSMLTPPSSATHVLFGAGLKNETTLKLAVVARKEEIFDQKDYGDRQTGEHKGKKVRNFYTYYNTRNREAIGFSRNENIRLGYWDFYDSNNNPDAAAELLDDHRLSILTTTGRLSCFRPKL